MDAHTETHKHSVLCLSCNGMRNVSRFHLNHLFFNLAIENCLWAHVANLNCLSNLNICSLILVIKLPKRVPSFHHGQVKAMVLL